MNPFANQLNPGSIGQHVQQSFMQGRQMRQSMESQNALSQYAMNPQDPKTREAMARWNPEMAIQIREREDAARQKTLLGQMAAAAAQGDPKAQAALWAEDPDLAFKLDDRQAKKAVDGFEYLANSAFDIIQRPPEQQAVVWDQYIDQAVAQGFDGMAQYRGRYSQELLNSFVAKVGKMQELQAFRQPKYVPVGEGGLSGFQFGRPIMQGDQPQDFGPPAPPGVTFTPLDGGPTPQASGGFH